MAFRIDPNAGNRQGGVKGEVLGTVSDTFLKFLREKVWCVAGRRGLMEACLVYLRGSWVI